MPLRGVASLDVGGDEPVPADWIGELANQLLGKVKQSFLRYGVDFDMGLPTNVAAQHYRLFIRKESKREFFSVGEEHGMLCFQYRSAPGITLDEELADEAEEDIILF